MALTSDIRLAIAARQSNSLDLGTSAARRALDVAMTLADGTSAGQANRLFADTRTLAASATENLDLAGALTDAFGTAQVFAKVKAVAIQAAAANTNNVEVTRPPSTGFPLFFDSSAESAPEPGISLRPGMTFVVVAGEADATGIAVTADTGDLITLTNSAGSTSVTYDIVVIGTSA